MINKLFFFIMCCFANQTLAQQLFLCQTGNHYTNYYVVETKGDTASVENYEFYVISPNLTEKLLRTNLKDTLFSNGSIKIVTKNGKNWIYWGKYKRKLKDYSQKQAEIASIRKEYAHRLLRNSVIIQLNQALGSMNYDDRIFDEIDRALSLETPRDSALKVYQSAANKVMTSEKAKVDFFKTFSHEGNLSEAEIISFLDSTTFVKKIEKDILKKIIINDLELLSKVVENPKNTTQKLKLNQGVREISAYSWEAKECRKALKQSTCQSVTKKQIAQKMKVAKNKETFWSITNITYVIAFYGLITKWIFF